MRACEVCSVGNCAVRNGTRQPGTGAAERLCEGSPLLSGRTPAVGEPRGHGMEPNTAITVRGGEVRVIWMREEALNSLWYFSIG